VSTPRTVTGTRRPALLRSTAQVAAGLDEPDTLLVNVLALLGRDDVAVYDGSMTAWAADPEQPPVVRRLAALTACPGAAWLAARAGVPARPRQHGGARQVGPAQPHPGGIGVVVEVRRPAPAHQFQGDQG